MPPEGPAATRITRAGHTKSRYGCLRCKARRVKCDEQRPCQNCIRHNVHCSLTEHKSTSRPQAPTSIRPRKIPTPEVATTPESWGPAPLSMLATASAIKGLAHELEKEIEAIRQEDRASRATSSLNQNPSQCLCRNGDDSSTNWMRSLHLFHYYCTSTCLTLHFGESTKELWKTYVPRIALAHEFLMHGLLALSARHFAHVNPDQRNTFTAVSTHHETLALRFFSTRLTDINEHNCEAYLLLAIVIFLLSTYSIANPQDPEESVTPNTVAQSFIFLQAPRIDDADEKMNKGVKNILEFPAAKALREGGSLSPLFDVWEIHPAASAQLYMAQLEKLSAITYDSSSSDASIQSCISAVDSLKKVYALCDGLSSEQHHMWLWPFILPKEFLDLLREAHPVALVVLAHFAALVKSLEGSHWARTGWSGNIIDMVERLLDDQWREWLEWPLRCVRGSWTLT